MSRAGVLVVALVLATAAAVGGGLLLHTLSGSSLEARSLETLSSVYTVHGEVRSMMGPSSTETLSFPQFDPPELAWVTGYRAEVVGADGEPVSQEFMCHANLDFDAGRHARLLGTPVYHTNRLFTLSQGQQEIRFPEGFGLPFYTDEEFTLTTQVLNLNPDGQPHNVRHHVSIDYVLDRDLEQPIRPLFMTSGWGLKLLEGPDGYYGVDTPHEDQEGATCLPGQAAGPDTYEDEFQRRFSGHWVVEPGREVNRTLVTKIMNLQYDTTLHYAAVHLHPFAESVELRDLTTGETLYKSESDVYENKVGLKRVDYFSSVEGIPVYADHEYEMVSVYNNTTDRDQDSMAVMLMYLADHRYVRRQRGQVPATEIAHVELPPRVADERVVLHTNYGDIVIGLYPDAAPKHYERILEMVRQGVYDSVFFHRIEPDFLIQTSFPHSRKGEPLTPEQQAVIRPIDAEFTDLRANKGSVLMALHDNDDPDSAEAAFFILLRDSPNLSQRYTIVGRVLAGFDTMKTITAVPQEAAAMAETALIEEAELMTREELRASHQRAKSGDS